MNLISNLNLNDSLNGQAIYSSQLYGTFFNVFARIKATNDASKKYWELDSMELKIMNYKGIVNLGIVKAEFITNESAGIFNNNGKLKIEVQALHKMPTEFITVTNAEGQKFTKGKSNIRVERYLKPMHTNSQIENNVFDEEFFYREGELYNINIARRNEHTGTIWNKNIPKGQAVGGWLCPFSDLILVWF